MYFPSPWLFWNLRRSVAVYLDLFGAPPNSCFTQKRKKKKEKESPKYSRHCPEHSPRTISGEKDLDLKKRSFLFPTNSEARQPSSCVWRARRDEPRQSFAKTVISERECQRPGHEARKSRGGEGGCGASLQGPLADRRRRKWAKMWGEWTATAS